MRPALFFQLLGLWVVGSLALAPTRTTKRNNNGFVTIENGQFMRNGQPFKFVGVNAYWLSTLGNDDDIDNIFKNLSSNGVKVVRTWAFNDVTTVPENGTWFQLIANNQTSVNLGPNGLQRLDRVVQLAEQNDILLLMVLTNNWNPLPLVDGTPLDDFGNGTAVLRRDVTAGTGNDLPRNFLSNDYGGMDAYVREFGSSKDHDHFYSDNDIINIFENYTTQVIQRYVNSPAIFAWELANDPRCNSSLPSTTNCQTTTITQWHDTVSQHVNTVDPNHLVSSGAHGFLCPDCTKLFPITPPPAPSPLPGRKKRSVKPVTAETILRMRKEQRKKSREAMKRQLLEEKSGIRIRGRWIAARQGVVNNNDLGSAFDGSSGVDSQDILNIPTIAFSTFQLFPDQNSYGTDDPNLSPFNNTVQQGINWIQVQAQAAAAVGKPSVLTAFGLVNQGNVPFFVPFNGTIAPFNDTSASTGLRKRQSTALVDGSGVSDEEEDSAYTQWFTAASENGVSGAAVYQYGTTGLTETPGSPVSSNDDTSGTSANSDTSGTTPNDGYQTAPDGSDGVNSLVNNFATSFGL